MQFVQILPGLGLVLSLESRCCGISLLGRLVIAIVAAKMGTEQAGKVSNEEWFQRRGACADYTCVDFRETPLKLLNGVPCVVS
jgi:hypothetical protein